MYLFNTFLQILKNCPVVRIKILKKYLNWQKFSVFYVKSFGKIQTLLHTFFYQKRIYLECSLLN